MTRPSRSNPSLGQVSKAQSYLQRVTAIQIECAQRGLTTEIPTVRRLTHASPSDAADRVLASVVKGVDLHRRSVLRIYEGVRGGQAMLDVLEPIRNAASLESDAALVEAFGDLPSGDELLHLQLRVFDPETSSMCQYEADRLFAACPELKDADKSLVEAAFALCVQAELQRSTPEFEL